MRLADPARGLGAIFLRGSRLGAPAHGRRTPGEDFFYQASWGEAWHVFLFPPRFLRPRLTRLSHSHLSPQVRRAKLFYLRDLVGKKARLKTRFVAKKTGPTRHDLKMEALRAAKAEAAAAAAAAVEAEAPAEEAAAEPEA